MQKIIENLFYILVGEKINMRKNVLSLILFVLFVANLSFANDGVFYVQGNNLIPLQETQVELRKEILKFYIKDFEWMDVDVDCCAIRSILLVANRRSLTSSHGVVAAVLDCCPMPRDDSGSCPP